MADGKGLFVCVMVSVRQRAAVCQARLDGLDETVYGRRNNRGATVHKGCIKTRWLKDLDVFPQFRSCTAGDRQLRDRREGTFPSPKSPKSRVPMGVDARTRRQHAFAGHRRNLTPARQSLNTLRRKRRKGWTVRRGDPRAVPKSAGIAFVWGGPGSGRVLRSLSRRDSVVSSLPVCVRVWETNRSDSQRSSKAMACRHMLLVQPNRAKSMALNVKHWNDKVRQSNRVRSDPFVSRP